MMADRRRPASRLVAARNAGEAFLDQVPKKRQVGGVVFNNRAEAVASPTTDRELVKDAINKAMTPSGGTATGDALAGDASPEMTKATKAPGAIVLLSDGKADPRPRSATDRRRARQEAQDPDLHGRAGHGVRHALPNGDAVPPDTATR